MEERQFQRAKKFAKFEWKNPQYYLSNSVSSLVEPGTVYCSIIDGIMDVYEYFQYCCLKNTNYSTLLCAVLWIRIQRIRDFTYTRIRKNLEQNNQKDFFFLSVIRQYSILIKYDLRVRILYQLGKKKKSISG